jgi:hypothetical protein
MYSLFLYIFAAHVSGAIYTHPQEHKLQSTAVGVCNLWKTEVINTIKRRGAFLFICMNLWVVCTDQPMFWLFARYLYAGVCINGPALVLCLLTIDLTVFVMITHYKDLYKAFSLFSSHVLLSPSWAQTLT